MVGVGPMISSDKEAGDSNRNRWRKASTDVVAKTASTVGEVMTHFASQWDTLVGAEVDLVDREAFKGLVKADLAFMFDAVDKDGSGMVSREEYVEMMCALNYPNPDKRIKAIFRLFDVDNNGFVEASDIEGILRVGLAESGAKIAPEKIALMAKSLVSKCDADGDEKVDFDEFITLVREVPELAGLAPQVAKKGAASRPVVVSALQVAHMTRVLNYLANRYKVLVNMAFIFAVCGYLFWRKFDAFSSGPKFELMGYSLPMATGTAECMKFVFALILLPMSRNLITAMRSTPLKYFIPIDQAVAGHMFLGILGGLLAWAHTLSHVCNLSRWADPARHDKWRAAFPDDKKQPSLYDLWTMPVSITGVLMVLCFTAAYPFALRWPKDTRWFGQKLPRVAKVLRDFGLFWKTHHLFVVFFGCLLIHPYPTLDTFRKNAPATTSGDTWAWISGPILIYAMERILRFVRFHGRDTQILDAKILAGGVLILKLAKPKGFKYTPGMYMFIQCPSISSLEWHPFTISSAPGDKFISCHIRNAGDWTGALHEKLKPVIASVEKAAFIAAERRNSEKIASPSASMNGNGRPGASMVSEFNPAPQGTNFKDMVGDHTPTPGSPRVGGWTGPADVEAGVPVSAAKSISSRQGSAVSEYIAEMIKEEEDKLKAKAAEDPAGSKKRGLVSRAKSKYSEHQTKRKMAIFPRIGVDGPYGAPTQNFSDYSTLVLVGGGIGVTPFASVLQDLVWKFDATRCTNCNYNNIAAGQTKLRKVHFFFVTRDVTAPLWIKDTIEFICEAKVEKHVKLNIYVTSIKKSSGSSLMQAAEKIHAEDTGDNLLTGLSVGNAASLEVLFGRPSWDPILAGIREESPMQKVGVFFCGPPALGSSIGAACNAQSDKETRFDFHMEVF
mmetsp:Transcript_556/g.1749  ORF Transcript_556/g.1749 Transcript_556/m.1749 type:complete len:897 (-) Transcript_556:293-2983(-)